MVHILLVSVSSKEGFDMFFVSGLNLTLNNALITWYDQVAVSSGVGVPQKKKKVLLSFSTCSARIKKFTYGSER